ncbi:MAG: hydrogenase maturation nickel metallochaperone HypA [Rubricoccaceae bacterium]|nr:hydrogenase maturation nickel metallochaperone HypA [Rubricoccaceae bacterium]
MHELAIAQSLLETASHEAARVGAKSVSQLSCQVGSLRQVNCWLLQEAFAIARIGTTCAEAELVIQKKFPSARCPKCDKTFTILDGTWTCPRCEAAGYFIGGGDELDLLTVEVEVDDAEMFDHADSGLQAIAHQK